MFSDSPELNLNLKGLYLVMLMEFETKFSSMLAKFYWNGLYRIDYYMFSGITCVEHDNSGTDYQNLKKDNEFSLLYFYMEFVNGGIFIWTTIFIFRAKKANFWNIRNRNFWKNRPYLFENQNFAKSFVHKLVIKIYYWNIVVFLFSDNLFQSYHAYRK